MGSTQGPGAGPPPGPPPYAPTSQALGESPSVIPDIPINAVFLVLFIAGAASHMGLFKFNQKRGRKFAINAMTFGFCFTRILATTLRIVWSVYRKNVRLAMAAMIFVYAGVILLFIGNMFFAQRIVRAQHPHFGWTKPFSALLPVTIFITVGTILCLIVALILEFYKLSESIHVAARDIEIYGSTFYSVVAFLPIPIVLISTLARRHPKIKNHVAVDKFGAGSMRAKIIIVLVTAVILTLGASFRAGTTWLPERPLLTDTTPPKPEPQPWYYTKTCFYIFNFGLEISIVAFWMAVRIDKRFIVPDGSKGPYSYGGGFVFAGETGNEKTPYNARDSMRHLNASSVSGFGGSARDSRVSWGGSRNSMARSSRVSWGGISREDIRQGLGEDGVNIMPYPAYEDGEALDNTDPGIDGVEQEMGWDPKSGKWALRPVSSMSMPMTQISRPTSVAPSRTPPPQAKSPPPASIRPS